MFSRNDNMSFGDQRLCPSFSRENPEEFRVLFLIENGSRFELKVLFLAIYMRIFSLHDFINIRKGCFKHLSSFYFIITPHCYSDCEYTVGTLKIILASQADETDYKENKKDF